MRFKDPIKGEIPSDGEETLHYFLKTVSTLSATSQWALLGSIPCNFHLRNGYSRPKDHTKQITERSGTKRQVSSNYYKTTNY